MSISERDIIFYLMISVPVLLLMLAALYQNVIKPFSRDKEYIKLEIRRAYSYDELLYWKRELKKLYISYIPIIGSLIVKHTYN